MGCTLIELLQKKSYTSILPLVYEIMLNANAGNKRDPSRL